MMAGILGTGRSFQQGALSGMARAAETEQQREVANEQFKAAERSQKISNTMTGAIGGAMIGAQMGSAGGPIGAVAGTALGYLVSEIF